jgi:YspA, cpYpsA-related SLOG family
MRSVKAARRIGVGLVLLVTGGRTFGLPVRNKPVEQAWAERRRLALALCRIDAEEGIALIVHGAAHGADTLAEGWCYAFGVPSRRYPVVYKIDGPWPAAGPRRNARMLAAERFNLSRVLAFPGGDGTADMCRRAREVGLVVEEFT